MAKKNIVKKPAKKVVKKVIKKIAAKKALKSSSKKTISKLKPKKAIKKNTVSSKKVIKPAQKKPGKKIVVKKIVPKTSKKIINQKNNGIKKELKVAQKKVKKVLEKKAKGTITSIKNTVNGLIKNTANKLVKAINKTETKFTAHTTSLKSGDKAPNFEGKDQSGNLVSLNSLTGKTVILYFYPKDDTPGCTATACNLRDEYRHLNDNNYAVVGVSADDEKSHAKFAAKYELPFPLIADTDLQIIKAYDVWGKKQFMGKIYDGIIRTTFVIAPDGLLKEVITKVNTANHTQQILGQ